MSRFGSIPGSEASRQNLKVSREGIVLIKSFEGFRPRAIQRQEGGWIIGYGHTLSAREGASVSEADAELLLRYDLLPVEKTLNETVSAGLNQHQFDALVSFAFSVGVDRFAGSDVRQSLAAGSPSAAAEAMMGWPEPMTPDVALRRRFAERALFQADPDGPVALSDLLSAPLQPEPTPASPPEPVSEPVSSPDDSSEIDPRGAAVAVLLGEPHPGLQLAPEPRLETEPEPEPEPAPIVPSFAANDVEADGPPSIDVQDHDAAESQPADPIAPAPSFPPIVEHDTTASDGIDPESVVASRYAPYSAAMVGRLPSLSLDAPREAEIAPGQTAVETIEPEAPSPSADPVPMSDEVRPEPFIQQAPVDQLVLTPLDSAPEPALVRPLWTTDEREQTVVATDTGLFGDELSLTQSAGPILGYDELEAPARFDWSETGAFIIMGAVGLTAFGASMAAFRLASEQSDGGSETTMIAWVLAVIGAACVGVSSFNLYRRWGLPGGD